MNPRHCSEQVEQCTATERPESSASSTTSNRPGAFHVYHRPVNILARSDFHYNGREVPLAGVFIWLNRNERGRAKGPRVTPWRSSTVQFGDVELAMFIARYFNWSLGLCFSPLRVTVGQNCRGTITDEPWPCATMAQGTLLSLYANHISQSVGTIRLVRGIEPQTGPEILRLIAGICRSAASSRGNAPRRIASRPALKQFISPPNDRRLSSVGNVGMIWDCSLIHGLHSPHCGVFFHSDSSFPSALSLSLSFSLSSGLCQRATEISAPVRDVANSPPLISSRFTAAAACILIPFA